MLQIVLNWLIALAVILLFFAGLYLVIKLAVKAAVKEAGWELGKELAHKLWDEDEDTSPKTGA